MTTLNQLTTSRLLLRPLSGGDAKDLLTMQSDPSVGRFIGDISNPAPEHAIALFGIATADAQLIGLVGIFTSQALDGQEVALECILKPEFQGQGLALEASRKIIEWGFQKYDWPRIIACVAEENERSRRLVYRLGMTLLKTRPYSSEAVYVLNRDEVG
jgi:RimJ/RimL family protein N-acetyltransferase